MVGDWLNPLPVPRAVLPVVELNHVIVPDEHEAFKVTAVPEQMFVALTVTSVGAAGAVHGVMVKLLFEISKKALFVPLTIMRAVVVLTLGMVTTAEPLFGTFDASVVG